MARFFRFMASVIIGFVGLASSLTGQTLIQTSSEVIEGDLVLPDGSMVRFSTREGSMITVHDEAATFRLGLVPVAQKGTLRIIPIEFTDQEVGDQVFLFRDAVDVPIKVATELPTKNGNFYLFIRKLHKSNTPALGSSALKNLQKALGDSTDGICCVNCGAITVCGGSVDMSCGSCDGRGGFEAM